MAYEYLMSKHQGFIFDGKALIAYDVMDHDEVLLWLRGQRK